MKFYNRKKEMAFIEKIKGKDKKQMVVFYGRRRIGKTTLMQKAFEKEADDQFLYFFVETLSEEQSLLQLSSMFSKAVYTNWYDCFSDLFQSKRYIVFDEFQNFNRINKSIFSALQHAWDETQATTKVFILGSYVGLLKQTFIDEKVPLFGRNDFLIKINPFSVNESISILQSFGYSQQQAVEIFMLVGGVPKYLLAFEEGKAIKEALYELFVDEFAPFKEEAKNIMIREFGGEHKSYFSILKALGGSRKKLSELKDKTQITNTSLSKYLKELEDAYEIIEKTDPILSRKKRDAKYELSDHYYNFYFNNIDRYFSAFEFDSEKTYKRIYPLIPNHLGIMFERFCMQLIKENPGMLPFTPEKIGKHWGRVPGTKDQSYDIDIIAYDEENVILCECKWREKKVSLEDYHSLVKRSGYLSYGEKSVYYCLFSKSGFEKSVEKLKNEKLLLFSFETSTNKITE